MKRKYLLCSTVVFVLTYLLYAGSYLLSRSDTVWSTYVASSLVRTGNYDLDEYSAYIEPGDYRIVEHNGHLYSFFPVGAPTMAVPFIAALDLFPLFEGSNFGSYLAQHAPDEVVFQTEKKIASLIVALNAVVVLLIAAQSLDLLRSVFLTAIFVLATPAWSTASRGLWQHGPSMLCLSLALLLLLMAKKKPALAAVSALPLGFAFLVRPTNIVSILLLGFFVLISYRRLFAGYVILLVLALTPFVVYSYSIFGTPFPPYYAAERLGISSTFFEAIIGNLASPSRGLFIFSPVLLLSIYGLYLSVKRNGLSPHNLALDVGAIILLHWLLISSYPFWHGGYSIGPRFFSDMTPYFIYLLVPVMELLDVPRPGFSGSPSWLVVVVCLMSASVLFQLLSVASDAAERWNALPEPVPSQPERLWDWGDLQFLRGTCPVKHAPAPRCWLEQAMPQQTQ